MFTLFEPSEAQIKNFLAAQGDLPFSYEEVGASKDKIPFGYPIEEGEERFTVEWNRADDSVWYELLAFVRPHHILARIDFPFVGLFQRKFARDSGRAMLEAVSDKSPSKLSI